MTSPVLFELIQGSTVQRLKGIAQFGLPDEYYHLKGFSRFDHSIGVMRLLNILGASEEEQIAGLLHDVSHTAFSHVIDWVVGSRVEEDWQDNQLESFVAHSEIPEILERYGYKYDRIVNHDNYSLLEQEMPHLCADRIDYTFQEIDPVLAKTFLRGLSTHKKLIVFSDEKLAHKFAQEFLKLQREHWGGYEAVSRYLLLADILKYALELKLLVFDDFWKNDQYVIDKLLATKDIRICKAFKLLRNKSLKDCVVNNVPTEKKFRYIDPLVVMNDKVDRLSRINNQYSSELQRAEVENSHGTYAINLSVV